MPSLYEQVGEERLTQLVEAFYQNVQQDPVLVDLFPGDWELTAYKQKLFQTQFLGGPNVYNETFGHPMMRMRHMPFRITETEARAWLVNMQRAMDAIELEPEISGAMMARYEMVARSMINTVSNDERDRW